MRRKNEKNKFYVEMDGRWAQLLGSEEEILALTKRMSGTRPVFGEDGIYIMHIN